MTDLLGTVTFLPDVLRRGPVPNPSRSFVLGDPKDGPVYGCIIDVLDAEDIRAGLSGVARIRLVTDMPELPTSLPIWYGGIVGVATDLRRVAIGA